MVPPTSDRVESATADSSNRMIYEKTVHRLSKILQSPSEKRSSLIEDRLNELSNEWDIERLLEFNAPSLLIITCLLGYFHCSYWYFATLAIAGFLWQHAIQGWCLPIPILQGIFAKRTSVEILSEKVALKMIRGDYQSINPKVFEQQQSNAESNARQLLDLADLHCHNDSKIKRK